MKLFDFFHKKKKPEKEPERDILKNIGTILGYPYQILPEKLSDAEITLIYLEALERGRREGFTPVLVPEDIVLEEQLQFIFTEEGYCVEEALQHYDRDGENQISALIQEYEKDNPLTRELIGEMQGGEKISTFDVFDAFDYHEEGVRIAIFQVPAKNPWEAVIYIPFGNWNGCPEPETMASICKYWFEQYQAVPALISHDIMEMFVPVPVKQEQAMKLAEEQLIFCEDIVTQGTGTIGRLADELRKSRIWYFWWD